MSLRMLEAIVAMAFLAGGCNTGTDDTDDTDTDTDQLTTDDLGGVWTASDAGSVLASPYLVGELHYLQLVPTVDGGGRLGLFGEDPVSGRAYCEDGLYGVVGQGLLNLSLAAQAGQVASFLFVRDGDTLEITNASGETAVFTRAAGVPDDARCGTVTVEADATFGVEMLSWSNLVYDGSDVRLPASDGVYALDLGTGSATDPQPYHATYHHLVTMQGNEGWGTCACGNVTDIYRSTPAGALVDVVDTAALGAPLTIQSGAWGGAFLWLVGYGSGGAGTRLMKIDSDAEPDVAVATVELSFSPRAIAAQQGVLYALDNGAVLAVDPTNGTVTGTWRLPRPGGVYWTGLTSDGTSLYVSGDLDGGGTQVLQLTLD